MAQALQGVGGDPDGRLALAQPGSEFGDVCGPVPGEVEVHRPPEGVGPHRQLPDLAHPEGVDVAAGAGDQIPPSGLEDQAVRLQAPVDDGRPALVAHLDDPLVPHHIGHSGQMRAAVAVVG
jgi:hypothetical protein